MIFNLARVLSMQRNISSQTRRFRLWRRNKKYKKYHFKDHMILALVYLLKCMKKIRQNNLIFTLAQLQKRTKSVTSRQYDFHFSVPIKI